MKHRLCMSPCRCILSIMLLVLHIATAGGGGSPIGNFGPTGFEIALQADDTLRVLGVQAQSPASGKLHKGDVVVAINGKPPVNDTDLKGLAFQKQNQLAAFITDAEATDGILRLNVKPADGGAAREVVVTLPVLGAFSDTWPLDCPKTEKIVRANARYLASVAGPGGEGLTDHTLYHGFAILMLLSTGDDADLDVVRKVYGARMAAFAEDPQVGHHHWHNGLQGMAACEYYLRTGDRTVMPLIDAICEAARKYQVHGGWSHWAQGVNPQYTAGGLMNAAGIQNLTTLLLAKQCGATVNPQALNAALSFFYRFAGHANVPYGDHRPEGGYGSNNGKTEMLALAMAAAARAVNGEVYAMARDKCAQTALYNYPHILRGHTGGNGAKWHGIAAALMAEKNPALYRQQLRNTLWFVELSRRHNGAMGASLTGRYDQLNDGCATALMLTAPRKQLQLFGAPRSPYAKPFRLLPQPWGRPADLVFLGLDGGPGYSGSADAPHIERDAISELDGTGLRRVAAHPEHVYRETAADAMREKGLYPLIEELLESDDPLARHTACMAINTFEPWGLRFHIGTRSRRSIAPETFTPRMFEALMAIITDPSSALWSVDQALPALACASRDQVISRLDDLLPWVEHPEWWLNESATIALTPAMTDPTALGIILPIITHQRARNVHIKGRGVMGWMITKATANGSADIRQQVIQSSIRLFETFVRVENPEPGVDISGITSVALESALGSILRDETWTIRDDPATILKGAQLAVERIGDFRGRELGRVIDLLITAGDQLEGQERRILGALLVEHFRPAVIGDDPAAFALKMRAGQGLGEMNKLLAIDDLAGLPGGWQMLGRAADGKQTWWHTSFDPEAKPADSEMTRYREVALPDHLKDWHQPDYAPEKHAWKQETAATVTGVTPKAYGVSRQWFADHVKEAGEVLLIRKTFHLNDLEAAMFRLTVYSRQGYDIFLNGHRIASERGRSKTWGARQTYFDDKMKQHLKVGRNTIAARSFMQYFRGVDGGIDVFIEKLETLPRVD